MARVDLVAPEVPVDPVDPAVATCRPCLRRRTAVPVEPMCLFRLTRPMLARGRPSNRRRRRVHWWTNDHGPGVIGAVSSERKIAKKVLLELDDPAQSAGSAGQGARPPPSAPPSIRVPTPPARPTVIPKFDPQKYADDSEIRERMPTITDEVALEQARLQSLVQSLPPPRPAYSTAPASLMGPRDSMPEIEIDVGDTDLELLPVEEQVAILRVRLAPLTRVPVFARPLGEIGVLEDPKAAYVSGFIDGVLPLETIIDVTGLPEIDTLRILDRLSANGAIELRVPK